MSGPALNSSKTSSATIDFCTPPATNVRCRGRLLSAQKLQVAQLRLIPAKEFGDRLRSGWVIACVVVWLGAITLTSFLGLIQAGRIGIQGYERTTISLLNLVQYLVPLLGLLMGHDLLVAEKEDKTLRLVLAGGIRRATLLLGKFVGGVLTVALPLALGFAVAGAVIGLATRDAAIAPFLRLAGSSLVLAIIFLGVGMMISTFARSRVQALVAVLLAWCVAVFVFDLVALGITLSSNAHSAAREIEVVCDPTHLSGAADIHSAFDSDPTALPHSNAKPGAPSVGWLALNPLDLFRVTNLPGQTGVSVPALTVLAAIFLWLACPLGAAIWKLHRTDL